jgi:hypothetical protein
MSYVQWAGRGTGQYDQTIPNIHTYLFAGALTAGRRTPVNTFEPIATTSNERLRSRQLGI